MTSRLDEVLAHLGDLGVNVEWEQFGRRGRGEYRWWCDTIVLSHRLTETQALSTLAHEIGHRLFNDTCSTPTAERRAWEYAAALLVTPDEYATAESVVGHYPAALALELGVTVRVIEAWPRWWKKRGQHLPPETLRRTAMEVLTRQHSNPDGTCLDPSGRG